MFTLKGCGLSEARTPSGNYKQTSEASVVSLRPTKIGIRLANSQNSLDMPLPRSSGRNGLNLTAGPRQQYIS